MKLYIIIYIFIISLIFIGIALYLLVVDGPKSWWSFGSCNCLHV